MGYDDNYELEEFIANETTMEISKLCIILLYLKEEFLFYTTKWKTGTNDQCIERQNDYDNCLSVHKNLVNSYEGIEKEIIKEIDDQFFKGVYDINSAYYKKVAKIYDIKKTTEFEGVMYNLNYITYCNQSAFYTIDTTIVRRTIQNLLNSLGEYWNQTYYNKHATVFRILRF
jgi:hypothetical protein